MKKGYILLVALCFVCSCKKQEQNTNFEKYVNPLIGTDIRIVEGKNKHSTEERGQNMPAVGVPHGMTNWVAQTQASEKKCHPPYYYYQKEIQGFRASRWMNGSCTQDYGSVTIMPVSGVLKFKPEERASGFDHQNEVASPSYYSVMLDKYNIFAELAGLSRAGMMNFDFRNSGDHYIVIEPNSDEGEAYIEINPQKREIVGYNPVHRIYQGFGQSAGFSGHFVIQLDHDFDQFGVWSNDSILEGVNKIEGAKTNVGAWLKISAQTAQKVSVKVGTSFTSIENARSNLNAEIPAWDFAAVRKLSSDTWNTALGKINVKGNNEETKTIFYTALYNAHFLPRAFSDLDGSYPRFDGNKSTEKADGFTYYCDFSMWDTYRAVHPLFSILNPQRNGEMAKSLVLKGQQGGWLPIFPAWNSYTAAMIGDHCTSMIGDAIIKQTPGFDYEQAYALMRKNAFEPNTDRDSYVNGKGRRAMESYLKYNYVPLEDEVLDAFHKREQVSRTLEYAYNDFVLAQVAKKLGKTDDYTILIERAKNYKNVIDQETGYARGRHADGRWATPFDPNQFVSYICEGTPNHYTWYVPQDVNGLIEHIGKERFTQHLDAFFANGYYWHGNEPCHHIAYLYAFSGEPWKTQKLVREILKKEYFNSPDGLSGNDDSGQMSYIQSATLNNKPYNKSYILHSDIMQGGTLSFVMGDQPNKNWASSADSRPFSLHMGS